MSIHRSQIEIARARVAAEGLPPAEIAPSDVHGVTPTDCRECGGLYLVDGAPCHRCHSVGALVGDPTVHALVTHELGFSPWEADSKAAGSLWWRDIHGDGESWEIVLPLWTPTGYELGKRVLLEWITRSRGETTSQPPGPIEWKPVDSQGGGRTQWNLIVKSQGFGRSVYVFDDGRDDRRPHPMMNRIDELARVPDVVPELVPRWVRRAAGLAVVLGHYHD